MLGAQHPSHAPSRRVSQSESDLKALAMACFAATHSPSSIEWDLAERTIAKSSNQDIEARLEYLKSTKLISQYGMELRFCLDSVAEYLAALQLTDTLKGTLAKWDRFLGKHKAHGISGKPFLLAILECCHYRQVRREVMQQVEDLLAELERDECSKTTNPVIACNAKKNPAGIT